MEEVFKEAAKQVPSLCVLVFVVIKFLSFIRDTENTRNVALMAVNEASQKFCERISMATEKVVDRNSTLLEKNIEVFGRIEVVLGDIDENVKR